MPKRIDLGNNKYTLIDDEDIYLNSQKWFYSDKGYAVRTDNENRHRFHLHREIINAPPESNVDHINGNTLDNRKCNLRLCAVSDNAKNLTKVLKNKTANFKGVSKHCYNNSWIAQISVNKKKIYLGSYRTQEEANIAYQNASIKFHGEFGYYTGKEINIVDFNDYEILSRPPTIKLQFTYKVYCSNGVVYPSITEAAEALGVKPNTVVKACTQTWRRVKKQYVRYGEKVYYYIEIP